MKKKPKREIKICLAVRDKQIYEWVVPLHKGGKMNNLRIFLTCLLEEFEAVVFFVLGIWLTWILLFHRGIIWQAIAGLIFLMVIFNVLTELIWRKK
jgi:hypothetical protein